MSTETSKAQLPLSATLEIFPEKVVSAEKITATLLLSATENKNFSLLLACFYGPNVKTICKPLRDFRGEKTVEINFFAPSLPNEMERQYTLYTRVYLRDDAMFSLEIPVMERSELRKREELGEKIPSFTVSSPFPSFIDLSAKLDRETPIISENGKSEFDITMEFRNVESGKIFNPNALSYSPEFPRINDEDMDKAFLSISAPSVMTIECDRKMVNGKYVLEFFNGDDVINCHVYISDPSLNSFKIYPFFIRVYYGYYFDITGQYTVKGED